MNLSRQTAATSACLALFLLFGGARLAEASILQLTPGQVRVSVGGISGLVVTCTDCNFLPVGGRIDMFIDNPSLATVSPVEVFLFQNPAITALNITGVGEGTTILRVRMFRGSETIPLLEAVATINVSPGFSCPIPLLLHEDREQDDTLATIRRFRDEVMGQSATGRAYTRQFSRHAFEVGLILLRDPTLFEEVRATLLATLPTIEAVVNGEPAILTAQDQLAIDAVLDGLQANASLPLQRTIHELRSDLHNGKRLRALGIEVERGR